MGLIVTQVCCKPVSYISVPLRKLLLLLSFLSRFLRQKWPPILHPRSGMSAPSSSNPSRSPVAAIGPHSNVLLHTISQEPPKAQNNIPLYLGKSSECGSSQVLSHVQATIFLLASIRNVPIWLRGSCCHMHHNILNLEFTTVFVWWNAQIPRKCRCLWTK